MFRNTLPEKRPGVVKNFEVWLRYDSRRGVHNMYREYRDVKVVSAVTSCYRDTAARHRARTSSVQIMRAVIVPSSKCRRKRIKQFHNAMVRFSLPGRPMINKQ